MTILEPPAGQDEEFLQAVARDAWRFVREGRDLQVSGPSDVQDPRTGEVVRRVSIDVEVKSLMMWHSLSFSVSCAVFMRALSNLPKGHYALNNLPEDATTPKPQWSYHVDLSSKPIKYSEPRRKGRWTRPVVFLGMKDSPESGARRALELIDSVIDFYGKPHSPSTWREFLDQGL